MSEKTIPHPSVFFDKKRLERIKGYRVHEARTPERPVWRPRLVWLVRT